MKTRDIWELTIDKIRHFAKDSLVTVCIFAIAFGSFCFILNIPKYIEINTVSISKNQDLETSILYENSIPFLPNSQIIENYNLAFRIKQVFDSNKLTVEQLYPISFVPDQMFEQSKYLKNDKDVVPVLANNIFDLVTYRTDETQNGFVFSSKKRILNDYFNIVLKDFILQKPQNIKSDGELWQGLPDEIRTEPEGEALLKKLIIERNELLDSQDLNLYQSLLNLKFVGFFENYISQSQEPDPLIPIREQLPINSLVFRMSDKQYFKEYLKDPKIVYLSKYNNSDPFAVYKKSQELTSQGINNWVVKTPRNWILNKLEETFGYTFPVLFGTSGLIISIVLLILLAMTVGRYSKNWAICKIFGLKLLDKLKLQVAYFGLLGAIGLGLGYIFAGFLLYFTMDFWHQLLIKDMMNYATNYDYKSIFVYNLNWLELVGMYSVVIVVSLILSLKKYDLNK